MTLVGVAKATVITTDQGPVYAYPADGWDTAELITPLGTIVIAEAESKVLGLVLSGENERVVPEDEPMPEVYRKAASAVLKDLRETIASWGKLDVAGQIHSGKGDAVKGELDGLLHALRENVKQLKLISEGYPDEQA